jgi:hypothetical protein
MAKIRQELRQIRELLVKGQQDRMDVNRRLSESLQAVHQELEILKYRINLPSSTIAGRMSRQLARNRKHH